MTEDADAAADDAEKAALMLRLVMATLQADTADGRAGSGAVLRELRKADPEALKRLATRLQLRRVGRGRSTAH